ncbi:hypothetical protein Nizo2259_1153 [Lactiplantibacillus plantarum]|nr:hypothetical protein LPST_C0777 [Lactiplantibacillus plantarum ST-III]KZD97730.1 hypothetical protein FBR5_1090 [Lactiplantibacillus plantarum]KZT97245.1 hypothetical protein Nizo2259_1153 [Lactiplantibacillus plantarum]KZU21034.1 hypothetical protein Nizo2457_0116 [Lactiplantibacillus plantarum]KZU30211.1 hypothetical protein Nizo2494_0806 [Lactiplantibacillus plantarum]
MIGFGFGASKLPVFESNFVKKLIMGHAQKRVIDFKINFVK